ncbi:MAG: M48 family metalloprotease, partial [Gammaproteobacteria bacterium]
MRKEGVLAGVLAHEIAHVVKKHHVEAIMKRARASLARDAAAEMVGEHLTNNPLVTDALLGAGINLCASGLDQSD